MIFTATRMAWAGCARISRRARRCGARKRRSGKGRSAARTARSEEHTSELQSRLHLVCRLLLEKKNLIHSRASGGVTNLHRDALSYASDPHLEVEDLSVFINHLPQFSYQPLHRLFPHPLARHI